MVINDAKLKSILNKAYSGNPELTDGDNLEQEYHKKVQLPSNFAIDV